MKRINVLLVFVMICMLPALVSAQTASERKKLKKELRTYRKMKPKEIRSMKLTYEKKLKDQRVKEAQIKSLQRSNDSLQQLLNVYDAQIARMEAELLLAKNEVANAKKGQAKGYYYRVQLGAYKYFDVKTKSTADESFVTETVNDMDRYTVGLFFTLEEADAFKSDIRKLGIKDAFVVPYKDGKRITHKEAAEGIRVNNGGKPSTVPVAPKTSSFTPKQPYLDSPNGMYTEYGSRYKQKPVVKQKEDVKAKKERNKPKSEFGRVLNPDGDNINATNEVSKAIKSGSFGIENSGEKKPAAAESSNKSKGEDEITDINKLSYRELEDAKSFFPAEMLRKDIATKIDSSISVKKGIRNP